MDLPGRAAFVTGGSGDLGAAICQRLASEGCDVAVGYVGNREGAEKVARATEGLGRRATMVQVDQANAAAIEPAVSAVTVAAGWSPATAFHLLGIDPHTHVPDALGRPMPIAGTGEVRAELLG